MLTHEQMSDASAAFSLTNRREPLRLPVATVGGALMKQVFPGWGGVGGAVRYGHSRPLSPVATTGGAPGARPGVLARWWGAPGSTYRQLGRGDLC